MNKEMESNRVFPKIIQYMKVILKKEKNTLVFALLQMTDITVLNKLL
jgi:hypothetical protein